MIVLPLINKSDAFFQAWSPNTYFLRFNNELIELHQNFRKLSLLKYLIIVEHCMFPRSIRKILFTSLKGNSYLHINKNNSGYIKFLLAQEGRTIFWTILMYSIITNKCIFFIVIVLVKIRSRQIIYVINISFISLIKII